MLDNLLNTVKKGAEKVQRRGEEVAQIARLKMEIFQLNRELDGHYARLGRAYHDGKEVDILSGVREDIRHTEEEIRGRERLITELGETPDPPPQEASAASIEKVEKVEAQPAAPSASAPSGAPHTPQSQSGNQPLFTNAETGDSTETSDSGRTP